MDASPVDLSAYVMHARRQSSLRRASAAVRFERAWEVARQVAAYLYAHYEPSRLVVFGSLVHPESFGPESDIDMAVDGIGWPDYLRAWNEVESLAPGFRVDLIDIGIVSDRMRLRIEQEGQAL